ncbi:hypothetical protein [Brevibacillus brevis]|uniref:hypothetical protein n=1 Tax=Brevibacillus brevis TaxID=1393 RepID=UPI000D112475|nr:hypothetical protein [Brevibacillus brevis]PSJ64990.1 hypothetical protein C7J99_30350 [Brevibacillus brevis]RED29294.1 hypothetical protein DES34_10681 [Brevibacillus brevis]VEF87895.1 Uncharacterised protein [Brevibacillus brevis]
MIKTRHGEYNGDSWEEFCQLLLKKRYDSEGYQEMPAHTKGDLGIEGFTRTGIVFQCYCPDEEYDTQRLYEAQRDKVTKDLGKLQKNKNELIRYLGDIKIRRWIFLTPLITNKEIVAHCQKKASEFRELLDMKDLLEDDFDVLVKDEGFYMQEIFFVRMILEQKIDINIEAPTEIEIIDWKECQSVAIQRLFGKISKLFEGNPRQEEITNKYVDLMVRNFIKGQKILDELKVNQPILLEKLLRIKNSMEEHIEQELLLTELDPKAFIKETQTKYKVALESENFHKLFSFSLTEDLSKEAEADWLVRCPLDFGGI